MSLWRGKEGIQVLASLEISPQIHFHGSFERLTLPQLTESIRCILCSDPNNTLSRLLRMSYSTVQYLPNKSKFR